MRKREQNTSSSRNDSLISFFYFLYYQFTRVTGYCGAFRFRVWWCGEWVEVVIASLTNFFFFTLKNASHNQTFCRFTDCGRSFADSQWPSRFRALPQFRSVLAVSAGESLRQVSEILLFFFFKLFHPPPQSGQTGYSRLYIIYFINWFLLLPRQ